MADENEHRLSLEQERLRRDIWIALGEGVILIVLAQFVEFRWLAELTGELGTAFFIAAFIALTVEHALKVEFARDAFRAAFSYVLPPELKGEVARVIDYRLLCIKHLMTVDISVLNNELVRVTIAIEREIKNLSREPQKVSNGLELDDWGFSDFKSSVDYCRLQIGDKKYDIARRSLPPTDDAIRAFTEEADLPPGATAKVTSRGSEIHRLNSHLIMSSRSPTVNPVVLISSSPGIWHGCTFGVPGERIEASSITKQYRLGGTQFPGQHTRIRWYPEDTYKGWPKQED